MELLRIEPGIMIWTWIAFSLVLLTLLGSTWKKIIKGLNARSEKIYTDLEASENAKEDAKKLLAEYRMKIDASKEEASIIIKNARIEANILKDKIIEDADKKTKASKDKIMQDVILAQKDALKNIKVEALDIATVMAESILKRNINTSDHESLIKEFIENNSNKESK